ncbi:MAG: alpha/beta fold hydrolase [Fimbriimonadia bacterium]|jgi:pimeloyl-ACP methyl ester carboxylesterase
MMMGLMIAAGMALLPKPTVVMIHGAGGGGWEYDLWKPVFEKAGWNVTAPDLLPNEKGLAETTLDDYVAQVIELCRKHERVVLVGASMGGMIALKAAEKILPAAVVLVNSSAPKGIPGREKPARGVPDIIRWAGGPIEDTRAAMPDSDEATIQKAWKLWRDESGKVIRELRDGVDVAKPTCPVLVVIGREDDTIPPEVSRRVAEAMGADVHEYAGMSHVGPLLSKRAAEVAAAVAAWLDARLPPTRGHPNHSP